MHSCRVINSICTVAVIKEKFCVLFPFYDHRTIQCAVENDCWTKTDIKSMIVPMAGEKHTLQVPPTQFEPLNINCLSPFIGCMASSTCSVKLANSVHRIAIFRRCDCVDRQWQTYLASTTGQRTSVHTSFATCTSIWWHDGSLSHSETSRCFKGRFSTRCE